MDDYELFKSFDAGNLPVDLNEYLMDYFEVTNDSYHRWYVSSIENSLNDKSKRINQWLMDKGAVVGEKVLFEFSW